MISIIDALNSQNRYLKRYGKAPGPSGEDGIFRLEFDDSLVASHLEE